MGVLSPEMEAVAEAISSKPMRTVEWSIGYHKVNKVMTFGDMDGNFYTWTGVELPVLNDATYQDAQRTHTSALTGEVDRRFTLKEADRKALEPK